MMQSDTIIDEGYKIRTKGVTTARKAPNEQQIRDTFQTPNYAIDLLIPFIPKNITHVWECASGGRKISRKLKSAGYTVLETDIKAMDEVTPYNFISDAKRTDITPGKFSIITNPPFSIKDLFIERCFEYGVPFAMLINADYSQQQIDWIRRGCEKIIPTSRIAYITPNILQRIHAGEVWNLVKSDYQCYTFSSIQEDRTDVWSYLMDKDEYKNVHNYSSVEDVPQELLYKYSNAQFHSMWLTYGFGIGKTETFVDLTVEQRKNNI